MGCHFLLQDRPSPGIEPTSPVLASGFLATEPPGKPVIQDRLSQKDKSQPFVTLVLCKNNLNTNLLILI